MRHGVDEIYKRMKKAIVRHQMIADDTPIMVGLSGGKDSPVSYTHLASSIIGAEISPV